MALVTHFRYGDQVVWRSWPQGQIGTVIPFTVVEDSPQAIALLQHDGSVRLQRTGTRGGPNGRSMLPGGWDGGHVATVWAPGHNVLRVHTPGTHHSVLRAWNSAGETYEGWYVNLELDWVRMAIGFDSLDLVLDVVVDDDLVHARLKDQDELDWVEDQGLIESSLAATARAEAKLVLQLIEARESLFAVDWNRWRPDSSWVNAELPPTWRMTP